MTFVHEEIWIVWSAVFVLQQLDNQQAGIWRIEDLDTVMENVCYA